MSTPPNKILEILNKKKEDITKDDKKVIKGMTIEEAEGAFGPQVRGSVETKGTGQYQYQYKTAPSKYLYKDGQLQLGPDNKPLINPLYRTGKLGSVVSAASLALQGVGPQADPFSKLGAIIAGSLAPIFMKGIGADIKYYRATEQIKQENKEAMAQSQASARADSTGLKAQRDTWKFNFERDMGRIKLAGANAKLESEQLEASKFVYANFMQMALSNPFGDDEEVSSFLKGKGDVLKRELLNKLGYNNEDIESSGGLGAFNDAVLIGAKAKDFGNIKIYETSNGIPLGPVYVKGQLVPSDKYAETLQEVISSSNGVELTDVGEAWKRATTFVDENDSVKKELGKLRGKAKEQQRFGLIKSYADEIVKRTKAGNKNKAVMVGGEAVSADEMFKGFTFTQPTKEVEAPKQGNTTKETEVDDPFKNVYTIEGRNFSYADYDSLQKEKTNLSAIRNPNPNQKNTLRVVNQALGRLDRFKKDMMVSHDVQTVTNLAATNDYGKITQKYLELSSKANYFRNPPEDLNKSIGILNDKIVERLGPAPLPVSELKTRFIPAFVNNEYQYLADYELDPAEANTAEYKYAQELVAFYNKQKAKPGYAKSDRVPLLLEDDKGKREIYRLEYIATPSSGNPFIRISKVKESK